MGKETAIIGSRTGARRFSPGRLRQHGYSGSRDGGGQRIAEKLQAAMPSHLKA